MRLLGLELERLAHVGLGLAPLLGALLANAAIVIGDPGVLVAAGGQHVDRLRIGGGAIGELLAAALDIAERHGGFDVLGVFGGDFLEDLDRLVAAVGGVEIGGE